MVNWSDQFTVEGYKSITSMSNHLPRIILFSLVFLAVILGPGETRASRTFPNIVIVMLDDLGFSDIGYLGSEIRTPGIDEVAASGLTVTNFYVHSRCSPTRAALLTGRAPHQVGMGFLPTPADAEVTPGPYQGYLDPDAVTLAERLKQHGYRTYLSGKWHLGEHKKHWPHQHGFDRYFGLISGASSYYELIENQPFRRKMADGDRPWTPPAEGFYMTTSTTDKAIEYVSDHIGEHRASPFLLYLSYTAPHWPLHAPEAMVKSYKGVYDAGPTAIYQQRIRNLSKLGLATANFKAPEMQTDENPAHWSDRMAVYAAQVTIADQGIHALTRLLKRKGVFANTLLIILSDNGASAEDVSQRKLHQEGTRPGERGSYLAYGSDWATVSNAPFRGHKGTTWEGAIRSPLILSWPAEMEANGRIDSQSILSIDDIAPTLLTLIGDSPPAEMTGESFDLFMNGKMFVRQRPVFREHLGWRAVRHENWKAVAAPGSPWSLFDLETDLAETQDLSDQQKDVLESLTTGWQLWSDRTGTAGFDAETFRQYFRPAQ